MNRILRVLLFVFSIVITHDLRSQASACPSVNAGPDQTICPGQCVNLNATIQGTLQTNTYNVSTIAYSPYSYTTGTAVLVNIDDVWTPVINMPFCFEFFGNTYNQLVIGSNGLISFDLTYANAYCQWPIGAAIPSASDPLNSIMAPWHDIDPSIGSTSDTRYAIYGTAPCRQFVVSWYNIPMFSSSCNSMLASQQIVLHESTNIIDIYISSKPTCSSWNGGYAIEGIQNATGTAAFFVAGRNYPSVWTTSNDGKRFMPAGAPNYTLTWTGPTGPLGSANPLTVCPSTTSTYTATVTNTTCAGNIVVTDQVTVFTTGGGITTTGAQNNITCNGQCTGTATVTITGGSGPFTYSWAPVGGSGPSASALCAGTYTCTISNTAGCTTSQTFNITQPPVISIVPTQTNVLCNGQCTGVANVAASGGIGTYTYSWAPVGGTGPSATGLCIGSYTCTVTSGPGCTATQSFTITQPTAITSSMSSTPATCSVSNGTASISASGGTGVLTYDWTPGNPTGDGTANITGLAAGVWTCTVTDANGCTHSNTITVSATTGLTATSSGVNVLCFGGNGSVTATPVGGTGPYTYAWSPSGGSSATASVPPGSYTCIVTDVATGCTATTSVSITQPTAVTASASGNPVLCNGGSTGTATVTPAGGVGAYTYTWTPTGGNASTATGLNATNYTVTVADGNGCTTTATVAITQPTALSATTSFSQSTCGAANGSAAVVVSGGAGGYLYNWTPSGGSNATATGLLSGNYSCTITDANNCTLTVTVNVPSANSPTVSIMNSTNVTCFGGSDGSATATSTGGTTPYNYVWTNGDPDSLAGNLTVGSYSVTVTDANGCTSTTSVTITQPPQLTAAISGTDILCFGAATGSAFVTGTGGNGSYSYAWSPAGGTADTASALLAGSYTCTITDANGCTTTASVTLTEPPLLTVASAGFNVTCFAACDGQLVAIPGGGTPNYTFLWSTGCTTPSCNNICAGQYSVTITDMNGCSTTDTATVTEPTAITITTSVVDAHCNLPDGSASAVGGGGTGVLTYQWIGGPANANYNNIAANTYSVIVTDANGCADTATATVNNLNGVTASLATSTNLTCFQSADGSIDVDATGGTPTYTYAWSPTGSTSDVSTGLAAGVYVVTITDASGCTATVTATLTEPPVVSISATSSPSSICIGSSVTLNATPAGGTPGYTTTWNPGTLSGNTQNVTPAATTTYTVDVSDQNGCTASTTVLVTVNALPVAIVGSDVTSGCVPLCVNFNDLSTITGAATITGWSWDFGDLTTSTQQNPSHCYSTPGNYNVILTVTTSDGCTQTVNMANYIQVFALPVASFIAGPQPTTILNPTIQFTDSSTNAASWLWSFGDLTNSSSTDQNPSFTYPDPDCYMAVLEVTSADGCMDTTEQLICIGPDVIIFVPNTFTPDENGINDVFIPVTVGIDPDKYELWVFDRWGNMIFYTDDLNEGWDGKVLGSDKLCQVDTYVWKINCRDVLDKKHDLIGHVNLIR